MKKIRTLTTCTYNGVERLEGIEFDVDDAIADAMLIAGDAEIVEDTHEKPKRKKKR